MLQARQTKTYWRWNDFLVCIWDIQFRIFIQLQYHDNYLLSVFLVFSLASFSISNLRWSARSKNSNFSTYLKNSTSIDINLICLIMKSEFLFNSDYSFLEAWLKDFVQVKWILLLLLLTTSASTCLEHSRNLGSTLLATAVQGSAKRRGCLLSYSQAEPGRELTQPSLDLAPAF